MQSTLVLTLLGPDRPGIVETVAEFVRRHDGNWMESRLAHFSGHFAGIVQVSLPAAGESSFCAALPELESAAQLRCHVAGSHAEPATGRVVELECVGQDRPGIVLALTDVLADFQVNVESLDTACISAPMSGESLFTARMRVRLPDTLDEEALEKRLADIGDELMLDLNFQG